MFLEPAKKLAMGCHGNNQGNSCFEYDKHGMCLKLKQSEIPMADHFISKVRPYRSTKKSPGMVAKMLTTPLTPFIQGNLVKLTNTCACMMDGRSFLGAHVQAIRPA